MTYKEISEQAIKNFGNFLADQSHESMVDSLTRFSDLIHNSTGTRIDPTMDYRFEAPIPLGTIITCTGSAYYDTKVDDGPMQCEIVGYAKGAPDEGCEYVCRPLPEYLDSENIWPDLQFYPWEQEITKIISYGDPQFYQTRAWIHLVNYLIAHMIQPTAPYRTPLILEYTTKQLKIKANETLDRDDPSTTTTYDSMKKAHDAVTESLKKETPLEEYAENFGKTPPNHYTEPFDSDDFAPWKDESLPVSERAADLKARDDNDAQLDDVYPEDAPHDKEYEKENWNVPGKEDLAGYQGGVFHEAGVGETGPSFKEWIDSPEIQKEGEMYGKMAEEAGFYDNENKTDEDVLNEGQLADDDDRDAGLDDEDIREAAIQRLSEANGGHHDVS